MRTPGQPMQKSNPESCVRVLVVGLSRIMFHVR